jgi:hypothetical protein
LLALRLKYRLLSLSSPVDGSIIIVYQ